MRVELIKVDGKPVGWTITAENVDDNETLNVMRELSFWGFDDTAIKYGGMVEEDDRLGVKSLKWVQKKHNK